MPVPFSQDDFVKAQFEGRAQIVTWEKTSTATGINWTVTCWPFDGMPTSGSFPTSGNANGRVCTMATSGAIQFVTASVGKNLYLIQANYEGVTAQNTAGTIYLLDRIADCLLPHSVSSGSISGLDATSRLAQGEGAQIFMEVQGGSLTGGNAFQIDYTNQDGVSGRLTPIFQSGARSQNQVLTTTFFVPLQTGDVGVRSIQGIYRTAGTNTGNMTVCLVKPLSEIPIGSPAQHSFREFIQDIRFCPKIDNNACLFLALTSISNQLPNPLGNIVLLEM